MFWRRKRATGESAIRDSVLEQIARTWICDQADVTPHKDGFDWLPGSHRVCVRIHKNIETPDPERFRLTIATDYLRDLPEQDAAFVRNASLITKIHCPTYSLVYMPKPIFEKYADDDHVPAMYLFSSAYISQSTAGWLPEFLARMSIMQPIDVEAHSASTSEALSCRPNFAKGWKRREVDDVLGVHHELRTMGDGPNKWIGSQEFGAFADEYGRNDICFGHGDERGMALETPFGSDSAMITFRTDRPHPALGNGLFIETKIRTPDDFDSVCGLAARLNFSESVDWSDFPQMGCWHPLNVSNDETHLAHSCFIPNAYFNEGLVVNFGLWAIGRVQWAGRAVGIKINLTMREILEERFGPLA